MLTDEVIVKDHWYLHLEQSSVYPYLFVAVYVMDPPEAWPAKSEATFSYEVGAKLLNLRSGNDNEDEDDIMRSSHAYHESMTQDCIEWDESKHNVDLRKLADPTFETPGIGDETPVHRAEIRSRPLRQSLEAVTRHLQSDCDDDSSTVQDIDEIFYQLSNGNGDDTDALIPRQRNSNAMLQQRPTSSSSTARDVFAVAGSHKRQRRENQKHVNLRKPLASIPEQHEVPPQLNVVTASKPPTDGSTDFDELLQQMQTSRDGNDPSPVAQAAVIPQAESHRSHAHLTDNNIPARPATVKHIEAPLLKHRPIRNAYRYQASSSTSGQNLSSSTNDFARLLDSTTRDAGNAHAAQTGQSRPVATVPAAQKAIAAPTDTATANDNDEFGDMDFCLDDFAKMDSILIAASTQHQSSQSQMVSYNFHSQQQKGNTQLHQVGSSPMNVSVTKGKNPIPEAKASNNDEMDDSFGDIPDIDIDALVLANKSGPLPLSPSRPVQQQSLQLNLQCTFEKRSATRTTESKDPSDFNTKENDLYLDLPDFNIDELIKQTEFNRSQKDDIEPAVHVSLAKESVVNVELQDEFPYIDFDLLDKAVTECSALSQQPRQTAVPPAHAVVRNPRRFASTNSDNRSFLTFSRYKVIRVDVDSTFTKTLTLACWSSDMLEEEEKSSQAIHHQSERRVQDPNRAWPTAGVVHLRGEWFHTRATDGDVLHIVSLTGQFRTDILPLILHTCPPHGSDSDDLVLVVHPDLLLTPTAISETLSCTRKAILKNRLGSTGLTCK